MDHSPHRDAQVIPFPKGGRDAVRRRAADPAMSRAPDVFAATAVDCTAWYHQAAMRDAGPPRQS